MIKVCLLLLLFVIFSCNNHRPNDDSSTVTDLDSVNVDMQDGGELSTQRKIYIDSVQPNVDTGRKSKKDHQNLINPKNLKSDLQEFSRLKNKNFDKLILISSGQMMPYESVIADKCKFELVKDGKGDTVFIATTDMNFITAEGYKVGMKLSELPELLNNKFTKENGWGFYYKLKSGWALGFCEGSSCTDKYPDSSSEIKWIFKRR